MGLIDLPDYIIPPPTNPGANGDAVWFDTKDGGMTSRTGILGTVKFDKDVTLLVKKAPLGASDADLIVVNGGGSGETATANTPHDVKVYFGGARTQVVLRNGGDPPTVYHVDGRLTSRPVL